MFNLIELCLDNSILQDNIILQRLQSITRLTVYYKVNSYIIKITVYNKDLIMKLYGWEFYKTLATNPAP